MNNVIGQSDTANFEIARPPVTFCMRLARRPTFHTWLSTAALFVVTVWPFLRIGVLPQTPFRRLQDALLLVAIVSTLAILLAVALAVKRARFAFFTAAGLHCAVILLSVIAAFSIGLVPAMAYAEVALLTRFRPVVDSDLEGILCVVSATFLVSIAHGLAALWLASTCASLDQHRPDTGEPATAARSAPIAIRIQSCLLIAGLLSIPCSIAVESIRERSAVERLRAAGAVIRFVPSNYLTDWLFGTRSDVALNGPQIHDRTLVDLPRLRRIVRLTLDKCAITDDGLRPLGTLGDLQMLWILGCPITDRGLEYLEPLQSVGLAGFFGDGISATGVEKLAKTWRNSSLVYDHRARGTTAVPES